MKTYPLKLLENCYNGISIFAEIFNEMKKSFVLSLLIAAFVNTAIIAQTNQPYTSTNNATSTGYYFKTPQMDANDVQGSMYFIDAFMPAKIECLKEIIPPLRYNAYKDEIEFKKDNELYYIVKTDSCDVMIDNRRYRHVYYQENNETTKGYLLVLSSDLKAKHLLFRKDKIRYNPPVLAATSYQTDKPASLTKEDPVYFLSTSLGILQMPRKKKELLTLFPEKVSQIEQFLKEKKISFNDENDLLLLTAYLSTL